MAELTISGQGPTARQRHALDPSSHASHNRHVSNSGEKTSVERLSYHIELRIYVAQHGPADLALNQELRQWLVALSSEVWPHGISIPALYDQCANLKDGPREWAVAYARSQVVRLAL